MKVSGKQLGYYVVQDGSAVTERSPAPMLPPGLWQKQGGRIAQISVHEHGIRESSLLKESRADLLCGLCYSKAWVMG